MPDRAFFGSLADVVGDLTRIEEREVVGVKGIEEESVGVVEGETQGLKREGGEVRGEAGEGEGERSKRGLGKEGGGGPDVEGEGSEEGEGEVRFDPGWILS